MGIRILGIMEDQVLAAKDQAVGTHVARTLGFPPALREVDLYGKARRDRACDLVLQVEDFLDADIEAIGPYDAFGSGVDQLDGDAHALAGTAKAAAEEVAHTQTPADLARGTRAEAKEERRMPRNHRD